MEGSSKSSMKPKRRQSMLLPPTTPPRHVSIRNHSADPNINAESPRLQTAESFVDEVLEEEEIIPQHHQVLIELLGADKAESILNPKIEEPSKNKDEAQEEIYRRKLPAVDTGLGAENLWKILKKESDRKLEKMDNRIPKEWKESYGAFLRDSITHNKPLVERSFTKCSDVKDLDKLLDKRYKDRVRKAKHHTNIMYRSSEHNKNKTTLLLDNNPVPDYNDREGKLPLSRYFDDSLDLKVIYDSMSEEEKKAIVFPTEERTPNSSFHFLTEENARTKGTFYGKYAGDDDVKMVTDIPGYKSELPSSMTARVTVSAPVHDPTGITPALGQRRIFSRKIMTDDKREPTWQPLTVGALMEYSPIKRVLGQGEFQHGQVARWRAPSYTPA